MLKEFMVESRPYWNQARVVRPLLLTVAFRVAEFEVIFEAMLVVTVGACCWAAEEEPPPLAPV